MLSVQPGLRGKNDLRIERKMATFQLFFQSGQAKDLSAYRYVYIIYIYIFYFNLHTTSQVSSNKMHSVFVSYLYTVLSLWSFNPQSIIIGEEVSNNIA